MNVIYVGFFYPDKMQEELLKMHSVVDFPGFSFQSALLSGLDVYYPNLRVVSTAYMSYFPKIRKVRFPKFYFSHKGDNNKRDIFVGVTNFPIIKFFSKFTKIRKGIKECIVKNEENIVILYEIHSPFMMAIFSLRKYIQKTCLIVPDLPEFMSSNTSFVYRQAKKIDRIFINASIKSFDSFVLFSPHMIERLPIEGKPWVQMEGIYNETIPINNVEKEEQKIILYTGTLGKRSGIGDLLRAFTMIKSPEYRLWIRGGISPTDEIKEFLERDSRIIFYSPMSKQELLRFQRKATVLVNPVKTSKLHTRFFFPSKTMEYLASGTPTVMYKLDCLPVEYDKYIYYINEETLESMHDTLVEICEKPSDELAVFGKNARMFILNQKNSKKQAKKVVDLIHNINNNNFKYGTDREK